MATKEEIRDYWLSRFDWLEYDLLTCFACNSQHKRLEKCHLKPKALGGSDKAENLVLLCNRCHRNAPNTVYKDIMLSWIDREYEVYSNGYKVESLDIIMKSQLNIRLKLIEMQVDIGLINNYFFNS